MILYTKLSANDSFYRLFEQAIAKEQNKFEQLEKPL